MSLFKRIPSFFVIPVLAVLIFLVDIPWLYSVSGWSNQMIRNIQGSSLEMKILPAAVVYIALGYLATLPNTVQEAFLLGSTVYAVYDFTNLATLKNYEVSFAIADSLWGGVLMSIVHFIKSRF